MSQSSNHNSSRQGSKDGSKSNGRRGALNIVNTISGIKRSSSVPTNEGGRTEYVPVQDPDWIKRALEQLRIPRQNWDKVRRRWQGRAVKLGAPWEIVSFPEHFQPRAVLHQYVANWLIVPYGRTTSRGTRSYKLIVYGADYMLDFPESSDLENVLSDYLELFGMPACGGVIRLPDFARKDRNGKLYYI